MDRREQGRGREDRGHDLNREVLPGDRGREVSFGSLLSDFEGYVRAHPHESERLLAALTAIALQNGGVSPGSFPPPPVDEFGRVGLPPANVPLAPYKAEFLARHRGYEIVNGEPVAVLDNDGPSGPPKFPRVDIEELFEKLGGKPDGGAEP